MYNIVHLNPNLQCLNFIQNNTSATMHNEIAQHEEKEKNTTP